MEDHELRCGCDLAARSNMGAPRPCTLKPSPRIVFIMILLGTIMMLFGTIVSCTALSGEQKAGIARIQGEIIDLVHKVETGELTVSEAKLIAAKLQGELDKLQESGMDFGEILLGLLGAFIAGAIGVPSSGVPGLLKKLFSKAA